VVAGAGGGAGGGGPGPRKIARRGGTGGRGAGLGSGSGADARGGAAARGTGGWSRPVASVARRGGEDRRCRSARRLSALAPAEGIDRKSTRLNSSHSQISYAVFCLKKKKISPRTGYSMRTVIR